MSPTAVNFLTSVPQNFDHAKVTSQFGSLFLEVRDTLATQIVGDKKRRGSIYVFNVKIYKQWVSSNC